MIRTFQLFEKFEENSTILNSWIFREAIANTPGAEIRPDNSIKLDVSRYQKPEQSGGWSVRTGVFFLPEVKSPFGKYYKSKDPKTHYGGSEFVIGQIVIKTPYIIKAGTGGTGPQKAYIQIVGKEKFEEMTHDLYHSMYGKNRYELEEKIIDFLDKYEGDPDRAYDIVKYSNEGNRLNMALREHIYAHKLRDMGYDSVLCYSQSGGKPRLSELYDLRQELYPAETNFKYGF